MNMGMRLRGRWLAPMSALVRKSWTSGKKEGGMVRTAKKRRTSGSLRARAVKLVDLIDYQRGSIVSREVINKETGTVTVFAFDEGEGLSEHTAPFDALVYVLDGEAEILISGKPFHLGQGEMLIMPARKPHALKALKRMKMLLIMVRS